MPGPNTVLGCYVLRVDHWDPYGAGLGFVVLDSSAREGKDLSPDQKTAQGTAARLKISGRDFAMLREFYPEPQRNSHLEDF